MEQQDYVVTRSELIVQEFRFHVYLEHEGEKFKPSDVSSFILDINKEIVDKQGEELSLIVLSGYEPQAGKIKPVAIVMGAFIVAPGQDQFPSEVEYYQLRLAEKFRECYFLASPVKTLFAGAIKRLK